MTNEENNLAVLRQKFHDVKFDLEGSDYESVQTIGSGTYGVVSAAVQRSTGKRVAIKKIPNIFENCVLAKRTLRELKILRHFHHDNIVAICEVLSPKQDEASFRDVYLVMDLMETDLYQIIRSKQVLTDEHIRYFIYQITCGLKYMHSANVIHRDLKPSNLLVNGNCLLKIADFGMARRISSDEGDRNLLMTWYVATRWYRTPELMLFKQKYTGAVDIWSLGCILAELLGRQPIFPGRNFTNQIQLIFGILGSPNEEFVEMAHADRIKDFIRNFGQKDPVPLKQLYPASHPKAVRLLEKMLKLNPKERISAVEVFNDLYLNQFHDPSAEPVCAEPFAFDLDEQNLEARSLRHLIYEEITKSGSSVSDQSCANSGEQQISRSPPDCSDTMISQSIPKADLRQSATRDSDLQRADVINQKSLTEHLSAASPGRLNKANVVQPTDVKFVKMTTDCPAEVATSLESCQGKPASDCLVGLADLPPHYRKGQGFLPSNTTELESKFVQNTQTFADFMLTAAEDSDLLPNRTSHQSHAKSICRLNQKNGRRKATVANREPARGGVSSRRVRGGRLKNSVKTIDPISLYNERGERIDVKAILKDSILSGHQNGEARRYASQNLSEKKPPSKTNQPAVSLSEDDKVLLKRWSEMQRAAVATVAVPMAAAKTKDPTAATDMPVPVLFANGASVCMKMTVVPHDSLPSENLVTKEAQFHGEICKYNSEGNATSAVPMNWSPSVQLSSGDIRSVLDVQGDPLNGNLCALDTKPASSGDIHDAVNTCDILDMPDRETDLARDSCSVLDVQPDFTDKICTDGDLCRGSLDHNVFHSTHKSTSESKSTKPNSQSASESCISPLGYSLQSLGNVHSLHEICGRSFCIVSSGTGEKTEDQMCTEKTEDQMCTSPAENSPHAGCMTCSGQAPMLAGGNCPPLGMKDFLSGDGLSAALSSGKLSFSGYGIGMDFEATFPEELSNLNCDLERPQASASFLSDWLKVNNRLASSDIEDVLNIISDM